MQDIIGLLNLRRDHIRRLSNQNGAAGESEARAANSHFVPRPKGVGLANLMQALQEAGTAIKKSSFDAIAMVEGVEADFRDPASIRASLPGMTFVEIKTANQTRVRADFTGFFFAFTESEIMAAEVLGDRHRVMLLNKATGAMLMTSVPELLARAKSTN